MPLVGRSGEYRHFRHASHCACIVNADSQLSNLICIDTPTRNPTRRPRFVVEFELWRLRNGEKLGKVRMNRWLAEGIRSNATCGLWSFGLPPVQSFWDASLQEPTGRGEHSGGRNRTGLNLDRPNTDKARCGVDAKLQ